ncbi:MAG: alpha/beta hydrolase [Acidobacteriota bacterium]|nr:alpha/beta hydrolase [Acidobacteriota bacterium]
MRKLLKRALFWGGGALILALVVATSLQWLLSHLALLRNRPPGEMVVVDGRQVHLLCQGQGSPAVILESAIPGTSLGWTSVMGDIASFARVCAYDRAGYGWSEAGPEPRTISNIAGELRDLLRTAGVDPPYVLAGHSFGGLVVQFHASRFPDEVAGMVLVDSSHPNLARRPGSLDRMGRVAFRLKLLAPLGIARFIIDVPSGNPESRPGSVRAMEKEVLATTRSFRAMASELEGLRESLNQAAEDRPRLGRKPLVVLTEGRRRMEFWHAMQEEFTELSDNSEWQVVDGAGHFIHQDEPDMVVDAVRRVVESARGQAGNVVE